MRRVDAPRSGWYPDPENRQRLRYWDGLDWTDVRRAPPSAAELESAAAAFAAAEQAAAEAARKAAATVQHAGAPARQSDPRELVEEVRRATRSELDRAGDEFTRRARQVQREVTPLISDYTNRIVRWIRFAAIVAVVLLVAYFVFQVTAQASLFEWIGDRIDNLTDQEGAPAVGGWLIPPTAGS